MSGASLADRHAPPDRECTLHVTVILDLLSYWMPPGFVAACKEFPRCPSPDAFAATASVATVLLATASWYVIEKPLLRLKTKLH